MHHHIPHRPSPCARQVLLRSKTAPGRLRVELWRAAQQLIQRCQPRAVQPDQPFEVYRADEPCLRFCDAMEGVGEQVRGRDLREREKIVRGGEGVHLDRCDGGVRAEALEDHTAATNVRLGIETVGGHAVHDLDEKRERGSERGRRRAVTGVQEDVEHLRVIRDVEAEVA